MAAPFSLSEVVRRVADESNEPDPHKLADLVLAAIPADRRAAALSQMLPQYIRVTISGSRTQTLRPAPRTNPTGRSKRWEEAADWRKRVLHQRVELGGETRAWKMFGELTGEDCRTIAADRRARGASMFATADQYERIEKALADHGVSLVTELPDAALSAALDGVAA